GVGGDRLLVVEDVAVEVTDDLYRTAPGQAAVGGLARQQGVVEVAARLLVLWGERSGDVVEGEGDLVEGAEGPKRDPGVGGALVVGGGRRCAAARAHRDLGEDHLGPARPAIHADADNVAPGATVRPAILLPHPDD